MCIYWDNIKINGFEQYIITRIQMKGLIQNMSNRKFIDDKITHIEDDIKKIHTKPNMYISYIYT